MSPDIFFAISVLSLIALFFGGFSFMAQRSAWEEFLQAWREKERVDGDYAPKHQGIFRYHRRRFQKRSMVAFLIGMVGLLLPAAGYFMTAWPSFSVYLWCLIIFFLVLTTALAIMDGVSTYFYYLHVRDDLLVEQTKLKAQRKQVEKMIEEKRKDKSE